MKTNAPNTTDKEQELKRFKAASARLVRSAAQDPEVAREFLNATGYFTVMSKACATSTISGRIPAAKSKTAAKGRTSTKNKAGRAKRPTVKAR